MHLSHITYKLVYYSLYSLTYYYMTIDIHKAVISNPISKNLLKPWGSNANSNPLRSKLFNRYTGPGNPVEKTS